MNTIKKIAAQINSVDEAIGKLTELVLPYHQVIGLEKTIKRIREQIQVIDGHQEFLVKLAGDNPCGDIRHSFGVIKSQNNKIRDSLYTSYRGFIQQHSAAEANQLKLDEMCGGQASLKQDFNEAIDLLDLAHSSHDKFVVHHMELLKKSRETMGSK